MTFLKNNREVVVLTLIVIGAIVMSAAIGFNLRGGNPWLF